jgi:hypothetical protein
MLLEEELSSSDPVMSLEEDLPPVPPSSSSPPPPPFDEHENVNAIASARLAVSRVSLNLFMLNSFCLW